MNLKEIAALSHSQIFPGAGLKAAINVVEFERTAVSEWAYQTLLMAWKEKADEGYFDVPSYLLTQVEKEVVNNEMDISDLKYFKSLPQEVWLQQIGELNCDCAYVKTNINLQQLLCSDDSLPDSAKPYLVVGKKIKFPKGVHKSPLQITFANMGEDAPNNIEVDDAIGALIRDRLNAIYLGKVAPTDTTHNLNPNV